MSNNNSNNSNNNNRGLFLPRTGLQSLQTSRIRNPPLPLTPSLTPPLPYSPSPPSSPSQPSSPLNLWRGLPLLFLPDPPSLLRHPLLGPRLRLRWAPQPRGPPSRQQVGQRAFTHASRHPTISQLTPPPPLLLVVPTPPLRAPVGYPEAETSLDVTSLILPALLDYPPLPLTPHGGIVPPGRFPLPGPPPGLPVGVPLESTTLLLEVGKWQGDGRGTVVGGRRDSLRAP